MKKLINYINESCNESNKLQESNWYNSLSENVEYGIYETYSELIKHNGAEIDNVLYKMGIYTNRLKHSDYINESDQDVLFNIEEQFAARNMLITIANEYINSLYENFAKEYNIITEGRVNESVKDFMNKVASKVKDGKDKMVQGFKELGEKVKVVKEFIAQVMKNAIKTAKELVAKITEMMISFGDSLQKLVAQLGGNEEESQKELKENIEKALKDEKTSKENVYESLSIEINKYVVENEYDDASKAKPGVKGKIKGGLKMIGKAGLKMLLQMMAYYAVTVVLPAVVTLIAGPLAGAIVEVLAKCIWSSAVIYKQIKDMMKTYKSDEYKNAKKWQKAFRWAMFFVSLGFSIWTAGKAMTEAYQIGVKIFSGAASEVLPSDIVQKVTEIFNSWYKAITGKNAGGYEEMLKVQNKTFEQITEITQKKESDFEKKELKASETNDFDNMRKNMGDNAANELEKIANQKNIGGSPGMHKAINQLELNTGDNAVFSADVPMGGQARTNWINNLANNLGVKPEDINIQNLTNNELAQKTARKAGTLFIVTVKGGAEHLDDIQSHLGKGLTHMITKAGSSAGTEIVQQISHIPANLFKVSFAPFAGLFPIAMKPMKSKGGFLMRMGSSRSGYDIYEIPADGVQDVAFNKAESEYGKLNPKAFSAMKKITNENYKALVKYKEELESKDKLSKDDKKKIKVLTEQIEKMKEGSAEYKVLIFSGTPYENKKEKSANEGVKDWFKKKDKKKEEPKKDLTPVMLFNPIMMACLDLAPQRKSKGGGKEKGPRTKPYYLKGIFSNLEFIQMDEGMSVKDVVDMFTNLAKESIKAAYNMSPDVPAIKDGKKYVVNDKSIWGEKPRDDFGKFTNKEITEILNDPDKITDYLGGEHSTSGGRKVEQTNTEKNKEKHDKAIKDYEEEMTNNPEVKAVIDKNKTLKKALYDKDGKIDKDAVDAISDNLFRIEKNYLGKKKKKGLFAKIKDFFMGKKDSEEKDILSQIDPEELKELALKLASVRKNKSKSKKKEDNNENQETNEGMMSLSAFVNEEFDDSEDFTILEANIEILQKEWMSYWYDELIEEDEDNEEDLLN